MSTNRDSVLDTKFHLEKIYRQIFLAKGEDTIFPHYIEGVQEWFLDLVLSKKWQKDKTKRKAPWECPRCNSLQGFQRRGSRYRVVKSGNSSIRVKLFQVTCLSCKATFSPFPKLFGLEERERIRSQAAGRLIGGIQAAAIGLPPAVNY